MDPGSEEKLQVGLEYFCNDLNNYWKCGEEFYEYGQSSEQSEQRDATVGFIVDTLL